MILSGKGERPMSATELLERVKAHAATGAMDWKRLRENIHDEFDAASTETDRDMLLAMFHLVMENVERNADMSPEQLATFRDARAQDYNLFLVKEALIGESVSVEIMDVVTKREIAAGRMTPDHSLRQLAVNGMAEEHFSVAEMVMNALVKHGRDVVAQQRPAVEASNFDFLPRFLTQATHMFVIGAMWRFGEKYDISMEPRDRALVAFIKGVIEEGVNPEEAKRLGGDLSEQTKTPSGGMHPIVKAGYDEGTKEGRLAQVLEQFMKVPEVAGAPYRLLDRAKPISLILGIATAAVTLLLGRDIWTAIGIGIVVGAASIAIALAIYRQMIKAK